MNLLHWRDFLQHNPVNLQQIVLWCSLQTKELLVVVNACECVSKFKALQQDHNPWRRAGSGKTKNQYHHFCMARVRQPAAHTPLKPTPLPLAPPTGVFRAVYTSIHLSGGRRRCCCMMVKTCHSAEGAEVLYCLICCSYHRAEKLMALLPICAHACIHKCYTKSYTEVALTSELHISNI